MKKIKKICTVARKKGATSCHIMFNTPCLVLFTECCLFNRRGLVGSVLDY